MTFLVPELIRKKREGGELTRPELSFLVKGFADGSIPDYQVSAWLMATFFRGMGNDETVTLTEEMKNSGDTLDWRRLDASLKDAAFADKHSTGGVGDKVSLVLAPLAACLGLKVPMMSGRGLGFTGGTVDKLQSIAGFDMYLDDTRRGRALVESGYCMMAQSDRLCPADRKLYALRDVTATIESLPLITGSIVSKKWAAGVENILYDVKCGEAAFMPTIEKAKELAASLVRVSRLAGMRAKALVTRMEEPLGGFVGNALEVVESVNILKNEYADARARELAAPLRALCIREAAEMAVLGGTAPDVATAKERAERALSSGAAYALFEKNLAIQGAVATWRRDLAEAPVRIEYRAPRAGRLDLRSRALGIAGIAIGAGRARSEDKIDPAVGFEIRATDGAKVIEGELLAVCHLRDQNQFETIRADLERAFLIDDTGATLAALFTDLVYAEVT